jgi:hypothetical protein
MVRWCTETMEKNMNDLQSVIRAMKVETFGKKRRLTIQVDHYWENDYLKVNGETMNRWQSGNRLGKVAAWLSAVRFAMQMIERFEQDCDRKPEQQVA